ncbi:MAG: Crp/Fnr family transcriptional regulator [Microcystaceae cyanobacterium]
MVFTYSPLPALSVESSTEERDLKFYDRSDIVPLLNNGVWQVCRGIVQLSQISLSGDEIILGWAQQNTFFGQWLSHIDAYHAKAMSEVYLRWYSLTELENSPRLTQVMVTQMARRMKQTEALLAISGLKRVEERLYHLLHLLKQEMGESTETGTRLPVRLTHQNLANAISTTRVTITRLLGDFQRQGMISVDEDRHLIIN